MILGANENRVPEFGQTRLALHAAHAFEYGWHPTRSRARQHGNQHDRDQELGESESRARSAARCQNNYGLCRGVTQNDCNLLREGQCAMTAAAKNSRRSLPKLVADARLTYEAASHKLAKCRHSTS